MKTIRGSEFIKRIQKFAKERGLACSWHPDMGKSSHGVLKLGDARTVVRNPKDSTVCSQVWVGHLPNFRTNFRWNHRSNLVGYAPPFEMLRSGQ